MKLIKIFIIMTLFVFVFRPCFAEDDTCFKYINSKEPEVVLQQLKKNTDSESLLCVSAMYYNGVGTKKNVKEAVKWLQKSVEQGYPNAQTNLAILYLKGVGVPKDEKNAYDLILKASAQNYSRAQYYLGGFLYDGIGVSKNIIEAIKWFKKSLVSGSKEAQDTLQKLSKKIVWKKDFNSSNALLILQDETGKTYPNESVLTKALEDADLLHVRKPGKLSAFLALIGCNKTKDNQCVEKIKVGIFNPNWDLIKEVDDIRLYNTPNLKIWPGVEVSDAFNTIIEVEESDLSGQYQIFVVISDYKNEPIIDLNNVFVVH